MQYQLPNNWVWTTLGDVGTVMSGGTPSTSNDSYFDGEIPWITPADLSGFDEKYISRGRRNLTQGGLENSSARLLPPGAILFSSRAPIGYVAIANNEIATNQGFKNLIPSSYLLSDYGYYYLKASKGLAESVASGSTFLEISAQAFSKLPIPLPPLPEQRRIVAKLDAAMERLQAAEAALAEVPALLEDFRRSVLHWAVTGRLVKTTPNKFSEKTLSQVCEKIQIGPFGSLLHKEDYIEGGIPLINPSHISGGKILPDSQFSVSKDKFNQLATYHLQKGDVIMGRRGEMGRCALIREKENGWLCGTGSLFFRPNSKDVDPEFLQLYLSSPFVKGFLERNAKGSTMLNLNQKIVGEIPIRLPDISLQKSIVREKNRLEQIGEVLEDRVNSIQNELHTLRQTLLARAFRGELLTEAELAEVRAEADYALAGILLEKIKAEKARVEEMERRKRRG